MNFFGNILNSIGNFFNRGSGSSASSTPSAPRSNSSGGGYSSPPLLVNNDDEERRRREAQARAAEAERRRAEQERQRREAERKQREAAAEAQRRKQQEQQQRRNPNQLGTLSFRNTDARNNLDLAIAKQNAARQPKKQENQGGVNIPKLLGSTAQQMAGGAGDVGLQARSLAAQVVNDINPFISKETKRKNLVNISKRTEHMRDILHNTTDLEGNQIVGTTDVDEAAGRIASGQGSFQDHVAALGKGIQISSDVFSLANPARIAIKGAGAVQAPKALGKFGEMLAKNPILYHELRDMGFFGGIQGAASAAQAYGQTGDIKQAAKAGATDASVAALLQGTLSLGGHGVHSLGSRSKLLNKELNINDMRRATNKGLRGLGQGMKDLGENVTSKIPRPEKPKLITPKDPVARPDGTTEVSNGVISKNPNAGAPTETPSYQAPVHQNQQGLTPNSNGEITMNSLDGTPSAASEFGNNQPTMRMGETSQLGPDGRPIEQQQQQPVQLETPAPHPVEEPAIQESTPVEPNPVRSEQEAIAEQTALDTQPVDRQAAIAEALRRAEQDTQGSHFGDDATMHRQELEAQAEALRQQGDFNGANRLQQQADALGLRKQEQLATQGDQNITERAPVLPALANRLQGVLSAGRGKLSQVGEAIDKGRGKVLDKISTLKTTTETTTTTKPKAEKLESTIGTKKSEKTEKLFKKEGKSSREERRKNVNPKAQKTISKATKKVQEKTAKEQGLKISTKNKAGGKIARYMAERDRKITNGAQFINDFLEGVSKKVKVNFKEDRAHYLGEVADMSDADAVKMGQNLFRDAQKSLPDGADKLDVKEFTPFSYADKHRVLALSDRYAYIIDSLAGKKKLTSKESKLLRETQEAQADLYERAALSESNTGRSQSLSSYLFRQLEPQIVSSRIIKKAEKSGIPYSKAQEKKLTTLTKKLKQAHDSAERDISRQQELIDKLGDNDPNVHKELEELIEGTDARNKKLGDAFNEINEMTEAHVNKAVKEGKITMPKTYGYSLNRYQKLNMLSGIEGRVRDMVTTSGNYGDIRLSEAFEALVGKVANKVTGSNKFDSALLANKGSLRRGFKEGLQKTKNTYLGKEDTQMGLSSTSGGKRGEVRDYLGDDDRMYSSKGAKSDNKLIKGVQAAGNWIRGNVAAPSFIFGDPYRVAALNRAGKNEAMRKGLKGRDAELYARAMEKSPDKTTLEKATYTEREISGLESKVSRDVDRIFRKALNKYGTWDGDMSKPGWRAKKAQAMVMGNSITASKNTIVPFTSWAMGTTKNMMTRQSITWQTKEGTKNMYKALVSGDEAAGRQALKDFTRAGYNSGKLAVGVVALSPFLSDTNANGEGYEAPYLKFPTGKGKYWSSDLSILGPLSAPLINAWAIKKATQAMEDGNNPIPAYYSSLMTGVLSTTGLSNSLSGRNVPIIEAIQAGTSPFTNAESKAKQMEKQFIKLIGNVFSQSIPGSSLMRDANSVINPLMGIKEAPQTKAYKEDGTTVDWGRTVLNQIGSIFPGVNQSMDRNWEGDENKSPLDRILGTESSSKAFTDNEIKVAETRQKQLNTIKPVFNNPKLRNLLSEKSQKTLGILEKGSDRRKDTLQDSDYNRVRDDIIKGFNTGSSSPKTNVGSKLFEDENYDEFVMAGKMKLEKLKDDPATSKKAIKNVEYKIRQAEVMKKYKYEYDEYKLYSDTTLTEWKALGNPKSDTYNPDLYEKLWGMDERFTKKKASLGSNESTQKYYGKSSGSKGGGGSGGGGGARGKGISTDISLTKAAGRGGIGEGGYKYRALKSRSNPIPEIPTRKYGRKDFKKKISISKGINL